MNAPGVSDQGAAGAELRRTFDIALTACLITFSCLEEETRRLAHKAGDGTDTNWKEKAKKAWKEDTMSELLKQVHQQQTAMALLVQTLQMSVTSRSHGLTNAANMVQGNPFQQAITSSPRTEFSCRTWSTGHALCEVRTSPRSRFQSPFSTAAPLALFWMEVRR
jgi:hypothetical protein